MKSVRILINSFAKARRFHHVIAQFDGEFDLLQDRYVINAKSQLGIFSLDISRPIRLDIYSEESMDRIMEGIAPFLYKRRQPGEQSRQLNSSEKALSSMTATFSELFLFLLFTVFQ